MSLYFAYTPNIKSRFAEHNKFNEYEILLDGNSPNQRVIKYFSNYLSKKDLSIGLLTTETDYIERNQEILDNYGITTSNPRLNFALFQTSKPNVNHKPKRILDELCLEDKLEDDLPMPCFVMVDSPRKGKKVKHSVGSTIELDESFHEKFIKLLIESGKDNVEIYKKAGVSRQVFSKIISDKNMIPTKLTLISLCIGLELPLKEAKELMISAGYSLSKSIMLDAIVIKYIEEEVYDFELINSELNEYGCQLLGWHPREK